MFPARPLSESESHSTVTKATVVKFLALERWLWAHGHILAHHLDTPLAAFSGHRRLNASRRRSKTSWRTASRREVCDGRSDRPTQRRLSRTPFLRIQRSVTTNGANRGGQLASSGRNVMVAIATACIHADLSFFSRVCANGGFLLLFHRVGSAQKDDVERPVGVLGISKNGRAPSHG